MESSGATVQYQERSNQRPYRLTILASHVVQYQTPFFRTLARHPRINCRVLFCSDWGLREYADAGFGRVVRWDIPLVDGFTAEFVPNRSLRPNPSTFWGLINPDLLRRILTEPIDALLIHGWAHASYLMAIAASRARGIPILLRAETNALTPVSPRKMRLKRAALGTLFSQIDGFLAIGTNSRRFYQAYGVPDRRMFLTPYAVDNDYFIRASEVARETRSEVRAGLGISDDTTAFLYCGKLTPGKRPFDLLVAYEQVAHRQRVALLIVGDGELRTAVQDYCRDREVPSVHLLGFQNQSELPRYYAASDALVFPSGSETWGLVVNEAMCFGLPVVITDRIGAGADLVRIGENGYVYPSGNVDVLAQQLETLAADPHLRQRMGAASRRIIEPWSYEADVAGTLQCLDALVGPRRSTPSASTAGRRAKAR